MTLTVSAATAFKTRDDHDMQMHISQTKGLCGCHLSGASEGCLDGIIGMPANLLRVRPGVTKLDAN